MARIRYIKPDFFIDPDLAELTFPHRLVFAGLWCFADKSGRLRYEPKKLKVQIAPFDNINMVKILENLTIKPFIQIYEIEGVKYVQIVNWEKHQSPHNTEKASIIPSNNGYITVKEQLDNVGHTISSHSHSHINTVLPTLEEVKNYCVERKNNVDANKWHDFYTSKGWMIGKNKMKDWQAAVRTWEKDSKPKTLELG